MVDQASGTNSAAGLVSCLLDGRVLPGALPNLAALVPPDAASLSLAVLNDEGNLLASSANFLCAGDLHVSFLTIKGSVEGSCVLSRSPIMLGGAQMPNGGPLLSVPLFGEALEGEGERPVVGCLTVQLKAGAAVNPRAALKFLLLAQRIAPAVANGRPEFLRQLAPVLNFESEIEAAGAGSKIHDGSSLEDDEEGNTEDELGGGGQGHSPPNHSPPDSAGGSGSCSEGERRDSQGDSGGAGAGTLLVQEPSEGGGAEGNEGRDKSKSPRGQQGHTHHHQYQSQRQEGGQKQRQAQGRQKAAVIGEVPGAEEAAEEEKKGASGLRRRLGGQTADSGSCSSGNLAAASQGSSSCSVAGRSSTAAACFCEGQPALGSAPGALPKLPGQGGGLGKLRQLLGKGAGLPPVSPLLVFEDPGLERGFRAWSAIKMVKVDAVALLALLLSVWMVMVVSPTLAREQLPMLGPLGIGPAALLFCMATCRRSYLRWRTVALSGVSFSLPVCWLLLMRRHALEAGLLMGQPLGIQLDGCVWLPLSALAFQLPFCQRLPLQLACYALALPLLPAACMTLHPTCGLGSCLASSAAKLAAGGLALPLAVLYWAELGERAQFAARPAAAG